MQAAEWAEPAAGAGEAGMRGGDASKSTSVLIIRLLAWSGVALAAGFLLNNYFIFWRELPSMGALIAGLSDGAFTLDLLIPACVYFAALLLTWLGVIGAGAKTPTLGVLALRWLVALSAALGLADLALYAIAGVSLLPTATYFAALILAGIGLQASVGGSLRADSEALHRMNLYLVRAAFWAVLLIGCVDALISFLRVEDLLPGIGTSVGGMLGYGTEEATAFGDKFANDLGRSQWRGPYIHMPLVLMGAAIAAFTRTLGFQWLALFVVLAELLIVIGRFVFSYEQTFMSDLVRFWYAALFLFASAFTLYEDGHVRVDIAYAGFSPVTKGWVNAIGCLLMGAVLCWAILLVTLDGKTSIVNGALLAYETSQSGFGMYIKYWMASFLAIFGATMLIQFTSFFLESVADLRGEPGGREHHGASAS